MPLFAACPSCNQTCQIPEEALGKVARCPKCSKPFSVYQKALPAPHIPAKPEPARSPISQLPLDEPVTVRPRQVVDTAYGLQQHKTVVNLTVPAQASNSFGIASLVVGVMSFFVCWIPVAGFIVAGLGLALGFVGFFIGVFKDGRALGFAVGGIVLSGLGLLPSLLFMVLVGGPAVARVQEAQARTERQQQLAEAADKSPAFIVSVKQALLDWHDNPVVAGAKYKNVWLQVSGQILHIAELGSGVEVVLYEPDRGDFAFQHDHVRCRFRDAADVVLLKTGQQVSIVGHFLQRQTNFSGQDLVLEVCHVAEH
jgi:tRNA_anti-like